MRRVVTLREDQSACQAWLRGKLAWICQHWHVTAITAALASSLRHDRNAERRSSYRTNTRPVHVRIHVVLLSYLWPHILCSEGIFCFTFYPFRQTHLLLLCCSRSANNIRSYFRHQSANIKATKQRTLNLTDAAKLMLLILLSANWQSTLHERQHHRCTNVFLRLFYSSHVFIFNFLFSQLYNKKLIRRWDSERELSFRRHRTRTKNTIDSCINYAITDQRRFTKFSEITQCNGHCAVQAFKVADFGTNQKLIYDFLFVINTNLPPILHCFQVMADYWSNFR